MRGSCLELAGVAVGEAWRHSEEVEEGRGALVDHEGDGEGRWCGTKGSKEEVGRGGLVACRGAPLRWRGNPGLDGVRRREGIGERDGSRGGRDGARERGR